MTSCIGLVLSVQYARMPTCVTGDLFELVFNSQQGHTKITDKLADGDYGGEAHARYRFKIFKQDRRKMGSYMGSCCSNQYHVPLGMP